MLSLNFALLLWLHNSCAADARILPSNKARSASHKQSPKLKFKTQGTVVFADNDDNGTPSSTKGLFEAPWIVERPSDVAVRKGKPFTLKCEASGSPPPLISWTFNGEPLIESAGRRVYDIESAVNSGLSTFKKGSTASKLYWQNATEADGGRYTCIADNGVGEKAESTMSTVTVLALHNSAAAGVVSNLSTNGADLRNLKNGRSIAAVTWTSARLEREDATVQLTCDAHTGNNNATSAAAAGKTWLKEDYVNGWSPIELANQNHFSLTAHGDLLITPPATDCYTGCSFACVVNGRRYESFVYLTAVIK